MPAGALWDLDGTLVDSSELHYDAWRRISGSLGHTMDRDAFARSFGKRNDTILRGMLGDHASRAQIEQLGDEKEELYRRLVRERGTSLLPGAREWLSRLAAAGWRQAIASSAPHTNIDAVLEPLGLRGFFDALVSAEEVGRGKPDPQVFLAAAERLRVPPARCVVVEDAPAGLEGARRAGMRSIGVLSRHFERLEADLVVPSLATLPDDAFESLLTA
jgi:beta-phosphoglucomutase